MKLKILLFICVMALFIQIELLKDAIKTKNTIIVYQTQLINTLDNLNRNNKNYPAELYEEDLDNANYFDIFSKIDSLKCTNDNIKYSYYEHL